jgi:hypothetical protein
MACDTQVDGQIHRKSQKKSKDQTQRIAATVNPENPLDGEKIRRR